MNRAFALIALGFLAPLGCSSKDGAPPPPKSVGAGGVAGALATAGTSTGASAQGGAGGAGGAASQAGMGGALAGGAIGLGGSGAEVGLGGGPAMVAPKCPRKAVFGDPVVVAELSGTRDEQLLAMTSDELTLALRRKRNGRWYVYVADRASASVPFDAPVGLDWPQRFSETAGVALSRDGLKLTLVSDTGTELGLMTRVDKSTEFALVDAAPSLAFLNRLPSTAGFVYSSPTLADSGQMYVTELGAARSVVVASRPNSSGVFGTPSDVDSYSLVSDTATPLATTGLSSDELTLLLWNELSGESVAAWREYVGGPLVAWMPIGTLPGLTVNADCTRLYLTVDGTASTDIAVRTRK